jgi:hypothetical protein
MIPFTPAWFRARAAKKVAAKASPAPAPRYYSGVSSPAPAPTEDFGTSYLVASATDSAPLGYMAGGSLSGALLGSSLSHHHSVPEPAPPAAELRKVLDAEGFAAMCKAANDCPACILAVLRPLNYCDDETGPGVAGPQDGRESWQYTKAKADWWAMFNDTDCRSYPV